jgi:aldose 1-epimerase
MSGPITGDQYAIAAGPYAAVVTERGGGLRALSHDERALTLTHDADEVAPAACGQLLMPWPNRIDHGRYEFGGESHQLVVNETERDNAIHGLVRSVPWALEEHSAQRVRLTHRLLGGDGYPYRLDLAVEYSLDATRGLTVRLSAFNSGTRPAPYGHGAHPYLTLGRPLDECTLEVTADRYLEVDDRAIPLPVFRDVSGSPHDFRSPTVLGSTAVDNPYTALRRDSAGLAWIRLSAGDDSVALWADEAHPWLEIYTLDEVPALRRSALGAEPMTCPPNAFVTGTDLLTLKPGETFGASWGITAG